VALRYKAIACAHLGRIEEAQDCVSHILAAQPRFTISDWLDGYAAKAYPPELLALFREGLRLAHAPD